MSTFGLGTMLAAMNIKYRDFRYVIPFFIQILFFLTPVIYPVSIIKIIWIQKILLLNPMAGAIELLRSPMAHTSLNIQLVVISAIASLVLFFVGLFYFRKTEYYFADLA
jgi:lipopolysaccharide transport system permease protein